MLWGARKSTQFSLCDHRLRKDFPLKLFPVEEFFEDSETPRKLDFLEEKCVRPSELIKLSTVFLLFVHGFIHKTL